jgi:hypothetical protein
MKQSVIKRIWKWLGSQDNVQAITALVAIATAFGASFAFVWVQVAPVVAPSFSNNNFGHGFRAGRREAELEYTIRQLRQISEFRDEIDRMRQAAESLSHSELAIANDPNNRDNWKKPKQ